MRFGCPFLATNRDISNRLSQFQSVSVHQIWDIGIKYKPPEDKFVEQTLQYVRCKSLNHKTHAMNILNKMTNRIRKLTHYTS